MKKFLGIMMLALLLVALTACSSSKNNSGGIKDEQADKGLEVMGETIKYDPNKLVNNGDPIEIEYWTWVDNDAVIKMAKEYEKIYPNVKIKVAVQPWDDIWTKLPLALKGKSGPAMFGIHNSQHDILIPYLAPYDIPVSDLEADFNSVNPHVIDGKVYYIDSVINTGNIYYNKKLWTEAGLTDSDIPKTWNQFREVAKKLTKVENGKMVQAGFNYNGGGGYNALYQGMNYQKGVLMFKEDGKTANFDNEATKETTKLLVDLYEVDKVGSKDFGDDSTMSFGNGQSAMVYKWGWMAGELANKYPDIEYGVFATPTPSEDVPFAYDRYNGESTPGINTNQSDEQQAVAQDFLKYLLANDNYSKEVAFLNASFPTKKSLVEDEEILNDPVLKVLAPRIERLIWPGPFPATIETTANQVIENILYNGQDLNASIKEGQEKMESDMKDSNFKSLEDKYQFYSELK
ncbi:extracellular solute-binding protein [Bacillus sp. FJAT-49711]|uniref:extracellular solute-binding protein n=1 Tax=Bacillus sp. FJAT-49711 TaxID=2833585 RepID=UPI001BC8F59C|nr:extracellular solute-binding protein [Bacillus sp. FJAT-49711]MBS4218519.1 extracellular solute-binding protein [Bacillus sp. FJAT-49711]